MIYGPCRPSRLCDLSQTNPHGERDLVCFFGHRTTKRSATYDVQGGHNNSGTNETHEEGKTGEHTTARQRKKKKSKVNQQKNRRKAANNTRTGHEHLSSGEDGIEIGPSNQKNRHHRQAKNGPQYRRTLFHRQRD